MAALRFNILANYAGQFWVAAMGIAFLPLYIRLLGMEAFGLVGLMLSFQSILQLFDFGIGGATNRELSRRAHEPALANGTRDLVRSTEILIWVLAIVAIGIVWAGSGLMAEHWLRLEMLSVGQVGHAIAIMAIAIGLLWPSTFYAHCLSGLEQQPALNAINAGFATLRYAGVVLVLSWVAPTIENFLWWHVLVGILQSLVTAFAVWRCLPRGSRPARWSFVELHGSRHFAGGLFVITLLAMGITQIDRLTLASLRPLEELGYYTLAVSVAAGLGRMVQPMFNAIYPRFSRLVAHHDTATLTELYHLSSQFLAVVVAAVASVLIVFSHDVLFLWTGDVDLANAVALPLSLLVAGTALNGLMNIPYALQLAYGWTRLAILLNTIGLLIGVPLCLWAVSRYGTAGAALPWLIVNAISVLFGLPVVHRYLLRGELRRWYLKDNMGPILSSLFVSLALASCLTTPPRSLIGLVQFMGICLIVLIASALASGSVRNRIQRFLVERIST